jgi:hypothetical protein
MRASETAAMATEKGDVLIVGRSMSGVYFVGRVVVDGQRTVDADCELIQGRDAAIAAARALAESGRRVYLKEDGATELTPFVEAPLW